MSGIKQHFIPQFLQRKFSKNGTHIYVYEKDKFYGSNISNSGAQRYFYTKPEDEFNTDKVITNFEGEQATLLNLLNTYPDGNIVEYSVEIKILVLTLLFRTKSLRSSINDSMLYIFRNGFRDNLKGLIREKLYKRYNIYNIKNTYQREKSKLMIDLEVENICEIYLKAATDENIISMISNAHNKSLYLNNYNENNLINFSSNLSIVEFDIDLILGDSIVFFRLINDNNIIYKSFPTKKSDVLNIIFPISKNKVLIIGDHLYDIKNSNINEIIASCSYDKFFSSSDNNQSLQEIIKTNADLLTAEDYESIIKEFITKNYIT